MCKPHSVGPGPSVQRHATNYPNPWPIPAKSLLRPTYQAQRGGALPPGGPVIGVTLPHVSYTASGKKRHTTSKHSAVCSLNIRFQEDLAPSLKTHKASLS